MDRVHYPYMADVPGHIPSFPRPSPCPWAAWLFTFANPRHATLSDLQIWLRALLRAIFAMLPVPLDPPHRARRNGHLTYSPQRVPAQFTTPHLPRRQTVAQACSPTVREDVSHRRTCTPHPRRPLSRTQGSATGARLTIASALPTTRPPVHLPAEASAGPFPSFQTETRNLESSYFYPSVGRQTSPRTPVRPHTSSTRHLTVAQNIFPGHTFAAPTSCKFAPLTSSSRPIKNSTAGRHAPHTEHSLHTAPRAAQARESQRRRSLPTAALHPARIFA